MNEKKKKKKLDVPQNKKFENRKKSIPTNSEINKDHGLVESMQYKKFSDMYDLNHHSNIF